MRAMILILILLLLLLLVLVVVEAERKGKGQAEGRGLALLGSLRLRGNRACLHLCLSLSLSDNGKTVESTKVGRATESRLVGEVYDP